MKKITYGFLKMLFATYCEAGIDADGYYQAWHVNKFVRLGYELQKDGVLLVTSANKLYSNNSFYEKYLLELGFKIVTKEMDSHLHNHFFLKLTIEPHLFEANLRLLLSDEDCFRKLGYQQAMWFLKDFDESYTDVRVTFLRYYWEEFSKNYSDITRTVVPKKQGKLTGQLVLIDSYEMEMQEKKPYFPHCHLLHEYYNKQAWFIIQNNRHLFL